MKARLIKKLSKKFKEASPSLFKYAWLDNYEPCDEAFDQGSRVSNVWMIGGEPDCWGEATEHYTCLAFVQANWPFIGDFPQHPIGHQFEYYPNVDGFKPTTINLLRLVHEYELRNAVKRS